MKLVELEELDKMPRSTVEEVEYFLDNHAIEMANFMKDMTVNPHIIPYLHCRQVGLEFNIIMCMNNPKNPTIFINPTFLVRDKKYIVDGEEVSESYRKDNEAKIPFKTKRAYKVLVMFDEYIPKGETAILKRDSEEFEGIEAVLMQQLVDLSFGKLITRFPKASEKTEE